MTDPWGDGEPTVDLTLHESVRGPVIIKDRAQAMRFSRFVEETCRLLDAAGITDDQARQLWARALHEAQKDRRN